MARKYDHEYKVQAVKLAKEIGGAKAAKELGIPEGTIHTWLKAVRAGKLDIGEGSHTPASAMSLSEEITMLRKRVKEQDKEIRRLKEENEFLEEASAFFAASRRKSVKTMETNMRADLCIQTLENALTAYPTLEGAVIHSDRGTQYTSEVYRQAIQKYHIHQSMNSAGGRCHDNARCESMWARMKTELLYDRYDTKQMTVEELKVLIWRYFLSYWNNRRICSANGGLPPMIKRRQYYEALELVA